MSKITRNLATEADKAFWAAAERVAAEVRTWPDWKRAGINVSDVRIARESDLSVQPERSDKQNNG